MHPDGDTLFSNTKYVQIRRAVELCHQTTAVVNWADHHLTAIVAN